MAGIMEPPPRRRPPKRPTLPQADRLPARPRPTLNGAYYRPPLRKQLWWALTLRNWRLIPHRLCDVLVDLLDWWTCDRGMLRADGWTRTGGGWWDKHPVR